MITLHGNPRRLWVRYTVGLAVLLAAIGSIHVLHIKTLEAGAKDAETINVSGRQRMLSQRIAYSIDLLNSDAASTEVLATAERALTTFEQSHDWLLEHIGDNQELRDIYNPDESSGLDADTRAYVTAASAAIEGILLEQDATAHLEDLRFKAMGPLLVDLNNAVEAFETVAEDRTAELESMQQLALLAAILIVLIEALVIFGPAQVAVNRSLGALEASNRKISEANDKLNHQLHTDLLTGVFNRHGFDKEVTNLKERTDFIHETVAVFVVDLDDFKGVNDRLGHASGDLILKHVGRQFLQLQATAKSTTDCVFGARLGGDEFMVCASIANENAMEGAKAIADLISNSIAEPIRLKDTMHQTKCSVGYAFIRSVEEDTDRALVDADLALLKAKASGKSCSACFEPHIRQAFEDKSIIINDFDEAIENEQIEAFFQPQVCLNTGQLVGFEALARWQHPTLGCLMPGQFLEPLTKSRRTHDLDMAVLRSGLKLARELRKEGFGVAPVSFNASAETLRAPDFIEDLQKLMLEFGTSCDDVKFEVLETVLIEEEDDLALKTLARLQSIGIGVELDDFGGGHSSLSLLGLFPFNGVKVDRSIVSRLDEPRFAAIAKSISTLGEALDMSWVAEGIEKHSDFSKLKTLGFVRGQGFAIAKPISPDDITGWLQSYGARPEGTRVSPLQVAQL
ncbi:MAG: EAL domain-containing protein [Pseudomonadota bacterium]